MRFMRLLSAGKSLMTINDSGSRYRMDKQFLLPKFGSLKNPAPALPKREAAPEKSSGPADVQTTEARSDEKTNCKEKVQTIQNVKEGRVDSFVRALRTFLNIFPGKAVRTPPRRFSKRNEVLKYGKTGFQKPPVQSELTWAKVKVARNDLSESDVELVRAKSPGQKDATVISQRPKSVEQLETAWGRVTEGTFGETAV